MYSYGTLEHDHGSPDNVSGRIRRITTAAKSDIYAARMFSERRNVPRD